MSQALRSRRPLAIGLVLLVAVAAVAAYLTLTAGPARAKEFATLRVLEGRVDVRAGGSGFTLGRDGQTLRQGDTVRTAADGRAEIAYFDGSTTRLDQGTEFTLEELASVEGQPQSRRIRGAQGSGRTLNRIAKVTDSESRFDVETPTAVASVRGTVHADRVYPDGSSEFWVIEGSILLVFPDGTTLLLHQGEGVVVSAEGVPGAVFDISDLLLEELCGLDAEFCEEEVLGEQIESTDEEQSGSTGSTGSTTTTTTSSTTTTTSSSDGGNNDDEGDGDPPPDEPPPPPSPDTRAPLTTIDSGPSGTTDATTATFSFHADEEGATFACAIDGHPAVPCVSPVIYPSLADQAHHFEVAATDTAGNTGPAATRSWTVEAREPDTVIDSGPVGVVEETTAVFNFHATEASTFECSLDGAAFVTCADGETYDDLDSLPHTFQVRAVDLSGKKDSTPATWSWRIGNPDAITITLTWSAGPRDLDLHVVTPGGHVAWTDVCLEDDSGCWAELDHDITNGPPGSETVTITRSSPGFAPGSFTVYVDNWGCSAPFDGSSATVTILADTTVQTFSAASASGVGDERQWDVAGLTVSELGAVTISGTQAYSGYHDCGASSEVDRATRPAPALLPADQPLVVETMPMTDASELRSVEAEVRDDGIHVDWSPDIGGSVRVSDRDFPRSPDDGKLGCEGEGECVIEDAAPGTSVFLTVLTSQTEVTPAEGVNALEVEVPADGPSSEEPESEEPTGPAPEPSTPPEEDQNDAPADEPASDAPPADEVQEPPAPEGTQPQEEEPPPEAEPDPA